GIQDLQVTRVQACADPIFVNAPADVTVECDAIPDPATVTATDNCDATPEVTYVETSNTVVDGCGTIVRTWTATDACGNSVDHVQTITVVDNTDPVFVNAPADVTVECDAIPDPATVTATDNCDATPEVTYVETSNTVVDGCGTIVRTDRASGVWGKSVDRDQWNTAEKTSDPRTYHPPDEVSVT